MQDNYKEAVGLVQKIIASDVYRDAMVEALAVLKLRCAMLKELIGHGTDGDDGDVRAWNDFCGGQAVRHAPAGEPHPHFTNMVFLLPLSK